MTFGSVRWPFAVKLLLLMLAIPSAPAILAQSVRESHVQAHVPDAKTFRSLLVRDAGAFLSNRIGRQATAEYEFLREGATQTGIAFPKFYLWVRAVDKDKRVLIEGAMRVAAIERTHFEVTDFLTRQEILAAPARMEAIFPRLLLSSIQQRAEGK